MKNVILKATFSVFVIFLLIVRCGGSQNETEAIIERNYCECVELFFDEPFNHFYLDNRTHPFTGICETKNDKNVTLMSKTFEDGKLTGVYLEYFESGVLMHEWNFLNNRQHGEQKIFNEKGELIHHSVYNKGDLDTIIFKSL